LDVAVAQVSRHALIKLTDAKGMDWGQGVVCLKDALDDPPTGLLARLKSQGANVAANMANNNNRSEMKWLTVDLSTGGHAMGTLRFRLRLSRRNYTSPEAAPPQPDIKSSGMWSSILSSYGGDSSRLLSTLRRYSFNLQGGSTPPLPMQG